MLAPWDTLPADLKWSPSGHSGKHVYPDRAERPRRRKARRPEGVMLTGAIATRAPRFQSFPASSSASRGGIANTDCPIHTTPGRWMNPGSIRSPLDPSRRLRPKTMWHARAA